MCSSKLLQSKFTIVEQPVQRVMMGLIGNQIIHNEPAITIQHHYGSFMGHRFVAIVFTLPHLFVVLEDFAFCPICPRESTEHGHLVLVINGYRVMCRCMSKSVTPDAFTAVEICPGIDSDVVTVNP